VLQKLRDRSNRPQKIIPKQSDFQVSPSKLGNKIDINNEKILADNQDKIANKFNNNISIMKRPKIDKAEQNDNPIHEENSKLIQQNEKNSN